jgi:hypothetical protein
MQFAHPSSQQVLTVFDGGFVAEQHRDTKLWNLAPPEVDEVIESLTASMFGEAMNCLRAALSLH